MDYSEKVVDHYTNPRNVGKIEDASGIGEVGNPVCGDIMKMFLKIENNIIKDVKFKDTYERDLFYLGAAMQTRSQEEFKYCLIHQKFHHIQLL